MTPLPVVDSLDAITIAVPCTVSWDTMRGDNRTRFCDKCQQNVHDVSELTREEALKLVNTGESKPCLRIYRRPDGRVMTADCTTKSERVWKWLRRYSAPAAALFALVFGCKPQLMMGGICAYNPDPYTAHENAHIDQSAQATVRAANDGIPAEEENTATPEDGAPKR
jgi:hypothetical protein